MNRQLEKPCNKLPQKIFNSFIIVTQENTSTSTAFNEKAEIYSYPTLERISQTLLL